MIRNTYLGSNIKHLRENSNLAKSHLAGIIGVKRSDQVLNYESGYCEPNVRVLINLSNFFNVSLDDLLKKDLTKI